VYEAVGGVTGAMLPVAALPFAAKYTKNIMHGIMTSPKVRLAVLGALAAPTFSSRLGATVGRIVHEKTTRIGKKIKKERLERGDILKKYSSAATVEVLKRITPYALGAAAGVASFKPHLDQTVVGETEYFGRPKKKLDWIDYTSAGVKAGITGALVGVTAKNVGYFAKFVKGPGTKIIPRPMISKAFNKPYINSLNSQLNKATTKREARKIFGKYAIKAHPDKPGGSMDVMQDLNEHWDEFKKSHQFSKLANLFGREGEDIYKAAFLDEIEKISGCKSHGKVKPKKAKKII